MRIARITLGFTVISCLLAATFPATPVLALAGSPASQLASREQASHREAPIYCTSEQRKCNKVLVPGLSFVLWLLPTLAPLALTAIPGNPVAGGDHSPALKSAVPTVTASFANTYTITASAGLGGTIWPSGAVPVSDGGSQTFTITPNTGYHVADVLVDGASVGAVSSYTFTNVTTNHGIAASFAINSYIITASAGSGGTISPSGAVPVSYEGSQAFTITPNTGYRIADILVDEGSVGAVTSYTFTYVTADHTIAASFIQVRYTAASGVLPLAGGSISLNPQPDADGKYAYGTRVTLSAIPNSGYRFQNWAGGATGTRNPITITIDSNKNVAAYFTQATKRLINLPASLGVWKAGDPGIDLSQTGQTVDTDAVIGPLRDSKKIPVVRLSLLFSKVTADIDLANQMVVDADLVNGKAVFYRSSYPSGVGLLKKLYVKKLPQHNSVRVVPHAQNLAEVHSGAPNSYVLTLADMDLLVITTPDGEDFWEASGIRGTGTMGETTATLTPTSSPASGRWSLLDPISYAVVGGGLAVALLYIVVSRLRRRVNRSR